jgi:anti-anti-sigma regulatory factor
VLHLTVTRPALRSARLALDGELDRSGVDAVGRLVGAIAGELDECVLDLSALAFVDVAGWRALEAASLALADRGVVVRVVGSAAADRVAALLGDLRVAS